MTRKWQFAGALLAVLFAFPGTSHAVIGASLFSIGGDVQVEILPFSAAFTNELHLFSPGPDRFIGLNTEVGKVVDLGNFPSGEELIFGIFVQNTGNTFVMGPGSRNPDGVAHADVTVLNPRVATVAFEDLYGGGDVDYNDLGFRVTQCHSVIPEPASAVLMTVGLLGTVIRRRSRSRI